MVSNLRVEQPQLEPGFQQRHYNQGHQVQVMPVHYGNTGCRVFKRGVQNLKDFCLRINVLKGNYSISKIGLVGASEVFKIRVLEINYFHPPTHLTNDQGNCSGISMQKMICISDNMI